MKILKTRTLYLILIVQFIGFSVKAQKANSSPFVDFKIPEIGVCQYSPVTLYNLGNPSNTYKWIVNNTYVSNSYNYTFTPNSTSPYSVTLIADSVGFIKSITKQVRAGVNFSNYSVVYDSVLCRDKDVNVTLRWVNSDTKYQLWRLRDSLLMAESYRTSTDLTLTAKSIQATEKYYITAENTCKSSVLRTISVRVKPSPKKLLNFAYRDKLFCNKGTPALDIFDSELNTTYKAMYYFNVADDTKTGNGSKITLNLPEMSQTKKYRFYGTNIASGCEILYSTDTIRVDSVIANFNPNLKNLYINETFSLHDKSYGKPVLTWKFDESALNISSDTSNFTNAYSSAGLKDIVLINKTKNGCVDSIKKQVYVHDTTNYAKSGWVANGGRIEEWEGYDNPPSFDLDKYSNSYVSCEFDRFNSSNVILNSYKGANLEVEAKNGGVIASYDKFGLVRWYNTAQVYYKRPEITTIKVIHDSLLYVGINSVYNINLSSTNGLTIPLSNSKVVAVYNLKGEFLYHISTINSIIQINEDKQGNIYFLTASTGEKYYLTKYTNRLDSLWTVEFSNTNLNNPRTPRIKFDKSGNVFVVGSLQSNMTVKATDGSHIIYNITNYIPFSSSHYNDIYLFKINSSGRFQWGNIGSTTLYVDSDNGVDVSVDEQGNAYLLCDPSNNASLYVTSSDLTLTKISLVNYVLVKYDSTGMYKWSVGTKMVPEYSGYAVSGQRVISDFNNNIYVLGSVAHNCIFTSTDTLTAYNFKSNLNSMFFVANYNNDGVLKRIWLTKQSNIQPINILLDSDSNISMLSYNSSYNYDIKMLNHTISLKKEEYLITKLNKYLSIDSVSINDVKISRFGCNSSKFSIAFKYSSFDSLQHNFIAELSDSLGKFKNPYVIGSKISDQNIDTINCIVPFNKHLGKGHRIRVINQTTGSVSSEFERDINFINHKVDTAFINVSICNSYAAPSGKLFTESGQYLDTILNEFGCDSIISINLTVNRPTSSSITEAACDKYITPSGKTITSSGIYFDTIPNINGCDSLITIDLTITSINNTVNISGNTLEAIESDATYKWFDCSNNIQIVGANNKSFNAVTDGSYAVEITKNNCIDTSDCFHIIITSVDQVSSGDIVKVYPNPTKEDLKVSLDKVYDEIIATILNSSGQIESSSTYKSVNQIKLKLPKLNGYYILRLRTPINELGTFKIIKE